jgi:hypothetical protein
VVESGRQDRKGIATQTLIRSHARRHARRGKKEIKTVQGEGIAFRSCKTVLALRQDRQFEETAAYDAVITDAINPFDSLPVGKLRHVNTLIHHCKYCVCTISVTREVLLIVSLADSGI